MIQEPPIRSGRAWAASLLAVGLVVAVLIPCVTPTTPIAFFDGDPRITIGQADNQAWLAIGPAGVAWLQVVTALLAVLATAGALALGARLRWAAVVLAGLGMASAAWHITADGGWWKNSTQGGAWIAAAAAGVAGAHLGQFEPARRWVLALLAAAALPLLAEAGWSVWVDHPMNVLFFEQHQQDILASHGILPGTEAAVLYERRLRFADATGTFGLSNVLASVAGAIGVCGVVLALSMAWRLRHTKHTAALVGLAAALLSGGAGLATVWLTDSKGAVIAVTAALALVAVVCLAKKLAGVRRLIPVAAVGLVGLAFAAVLVRGAMGPPEAPPNGFEPGREIQGERSLLFRSHYWSAAARIAKQHPLMGSGPHGFADLYPAVKNPLNPETVTSTHNVLVDQITMLGVGGWAWSALLLGWLWLAGRGVMQSDSLEEEEKAVLPDRPTLWTAVAAATVLFGTALTVRHAGLYRDTALLWLLAIGVFVAVAAILGMRGVVKPFWQRVALLAGAAAVLVHNQVEMAFFQPAAMGLLWLIVATAGGASLSRRRRCASSDTTAAQDAAARPAQNKKTLKRNLMVVLPLGGLLVVTLGMNASKIQQHENAMARAAAAVLRGDPQRAVQRLAVAQDAAGLDTNALRWRAYFYAMEPLEYLVQNHRQTDARQRIAAALGWIDAAAEGRPASTRLIRLKATLLDRQADQFEQRADFQAAEQAYGEVLAKSPYNIQDTLTWADLAARLGHGDDARQRYEKVLELRERKYLDAADPLTPEQLARARAALQTSAPTPPPAPSD